VTIPVNLAQTKKEQTGIGATGAQSLERRYFISVTSQHGAKQCQMTPMIFCVFHLQMKKSVKISVLIHSENEEKV